MGAILRIGGYPGCLATTSLLSNKPERLDNWSKQEYAQVVHIQWKQRLLFATLTMLIEGLGGGGGGGCTATNLPKAPFCPNLSLTGRYVKHN